VIPLKPKPGLTRISCKRHPAFDSWAWRGPPLKIGLGHKKYFPHHGEALSRQKRIERGKIWGHGLLPPGIDRIGFDPGPGLLKVLDMHGEEK
jgi:hypothetical protein